MSSLIEPAAKRRRLDGPSPCFEPLDDLIPEPFSSYTPIARAQVSVECADHSCSRLGDEVPVIVKRITDDDSPRIVIALPRLKLAPIVATSKAVDGRTRRTLEYAVELDTIFKYKSESTSLPLACAYATLRCRSNRLHVLDVQIIWQDTSEARDKIDPLSFEILRWVYDQGSAQTSVAPEVWDPRQFYDNVHVPLANDKNSKDLKIDLLHCELYPFQRRAVHWLLEREGVQSGESGQISPLLGQDIENAGLPAGFLTVRDGNGQICYVNHALGVVCSDFRRIRRHYGAIRGGILAEEMGLGKTVELIALMCLHTRPITAKQETTSAAPLHRSRATLIITPPTILEQWRQELQDHAPSLKVFHYQGAKAKDRYASHTIESLADFDVILTTYNVIAKEVHYVAERPDRIMRHKPKYDPPKSPLTQISWWRVCLDEAQMVESGVSAAATVARLIPRENAWAVTGTPLRKNHRDLFGLLLFLRYEPWCNSARSWDTLVSYHRPLFRALMGEIAIRHSKELVREDLRLPPQSRHTITIPFTAIEEQHYGQMFHDMYQDCGLDRSGAPLDAEWDPDSPAVIEKMRTWLTRLRQTCLHPEVGGRNRRALGRSGGPLRTVQQVLDVMIDQNEGLLRTEQRSLLISRVRRGQMQENAKNTKAAMAIWKSAYDDSTKIVIECREQLKADLVARKLNEKKAEQKAEESSDEEDNDESDAHLHALRQRLRSALELKHICIFFIANAYFQLKSDESSVKPDSEEFQALEKQETTSYEEAKAIRTELLAENLRKVNRLISKVKSKDSITVIPEMSVDLEYAGIETRKVFDKLDTFCHVMNVQAEQFQALRQKMIDFLRQSLIDEDEGVELQGDEYESSTKHQDEMYAYMEGLRVLYADRSDAISGQENLLIRQEVKQFLRSANAGEGPAPELMLKLLAEREAKRVKLAEHASLRGIVAEIRQLVTALQWQEAGGSTRARAELAIANDVLQHAQKLVNVQTKALTSLEQEVNQFRETMNSRLDYYRALQKISDTVAPFDEESIGQPFQEVRFNHMLKDEERTSNRASTLQSKHRYLLHLKTESSSTADPRICTICQCEFETGTLTVCGHQFCKECIQLWHAEHHNCPVCKRRLHTADFFDITYKPAEMAVQAETPATESSSPGSERSLNKSIYSDISTTTLNEIKNIEINGASFGSKVDTICRHLLWLRRHDPGSKAIIFSQYREFLDVLGRALNQCKIAFSRFDDKNGIERFKSDPAVECFLLHAKAHAAGLNLVVASHVFLCEPLINTAIELQAIARVHRIGQHRATTVWMYLVADTVEESIYDISVTRRLAHMKGKQANNRITSRSGTATPHEGLKENAIDAANSMELQAADLTRLLTSGKSGGEMVDKEDLWACLFGRVKGRAAGVFDDAESAPAASAVGRFLRAEAADARSGLA